MTTKTQPADLLAPLLALAEVLRASQQQCDEDGTMIAVFRQALDETLAAISSLAAHRGEVDTGNYVHDPLYKALDALYDRGWTDLQQQRKYDARGTNQWQAVLDLFRAYAPHPPQAQAGAGDGVALIAAERRRQVEGEGWTPEHDDEHAHNELATAAACYAAPELCGYEDDCGTKPRKAILGHWPWGVQWWKPGDRIRELVKAGALIAAEIDRLKRVALEASHEPE